MRESYFYDPFVAYIQHSKEGLVIDDSTYSSLCNVKVVPREKLKLHSRLASMEMNWDTSTLLLM